LIVNRYACTRLVTALIALVPILFASAGCNPLDDRSERSILLITLDTTRADRLGPYGYEAARTPALDAFAAEGTLFERAYSVGPVTLPSHSTMFTGLLPPSHGVRYNGYYRLADEARTLAEILQEAGFATEAIVASEPLDRRYGLPQGFDHYSDPRSVGKRARNAEEIVEYTTTLLDGLEGKSWFLWVHFFDPHTPYVPPESFRQGDSDSELYDAEIAYMDVWLGKLLGRFRERGLLDNTLTVLAGDHGEGLGDHGESQHTLFIYDATTHVPLLLQGPGVPKGQRVDDVVSLVDIFATALDFVGIDPGETSSAVLPSLFGSDGSEAVPVYSEAMGTVHYGWAPLQAIRNEDWFYIEAPDDELYEVGKTDPEDLENLAFTERYERQEMRELLQRTLAEMPDTGYADSSGKTVSGEEAAELASLGYLGGSSGDEDSTDDFDVLPDPKDMVEVSEAIHIANHALSLRRPLLALELLEWATEANPENGVVWMSFGRVLTQLRRFEEAAVAMRNGLERGADSWNDLRSAADAERAIGNFDAAEKLLLNAVETSPFPADLWRAIGSTRIERTDTSGAIDAFEKCLELDPEDAVAKLELDRLLSP